MKLTKLHLFLLIIVVLLLSTLGFSIKEYFESSNGETKTITETQETHKTRRQANKQQQKRNDNKKI